MNWIAPTSRLRRSFWNSFPTFNCQFPEYGMLKAEHPPIVVITSNRTREIHDAVKRRCFYHWVDYPSASQETEILRRRAPHAAESLTRGIG